MYVSNVLPQPPKRSHFYNNARFSWCNQSVRAAASSTVQLKPKPIALVVGNETDGISGAWKHADVVVRFYEHSGGISECGVTTGISVYELKLKDGACYVNPIYPLNLGREMNVTGKMIQMALDHGI